MERQEDFDRFLYQIRSPNPVPRSSSSLTTASSSNDPHQLLLNNINNPFQACPDSFYDLNLESSFSRLGFSNPNHPPPRSPLFPALPSSLPFGNVSSMPLLQNNGFGSSSLSEQYLLDPHLSPHLVQQAAIELERRVRSQMASSLALNAHHQSHSSPSHPINGTQLRKFPSGNTCPFSETSSPFNICNDICFQQLHRRSLGREYGRQDSIREFQNGYQSFINSDNQYFEFGNAASRRRLKQQDGVVSLAKDQEGCRLLQKKFENGTVHIQSLLMEVKDHLHELMIDPFGNYFMQKLIEMCSEEQMTEILSYVMKNKYDLISICLDMHGTRVVQKLLEHLKTPQQIAQVISALGPGTIDLIKNMNGHHVVERCLEYFSNEYSKCLSDAIADHCLDVAMNQNGCCVLQKCIKVAKGEQRDHLVDEIVTNALLLSQDQYGNYVVQYILDLEMPDVTTNLLRQFEGNYASLSIQKFSSNVVEKCLKKSQEKEFTKIINELLESPYAVTIFQNPFGNYVIQSALGVAKGPTYAAIVGRVERELTSLSSNPYGKRVVACIQSTKK